MQAVLIAPWVLLVLWAVYVFSFASCVKTDAEGLTAQNALRRIRVPWGRITAIEVRWQVNVTLDDGAVVRALGGPSASPRGVQRAERRDVALSATEQSEDIVEQWERARRGAAKGERVRREWDLPALLVLVVLVVWAVVAVLVAGM